MRNEQVLPKLAPPGAGIPWPAKIFLRLYTRPFVAAKASWEESKENFIKVNQKIFNEIQGLSSERLDQRILVPPQLGLEDSSRYWSVAMTLEHLVIVSSQVAAVIESLSAGKVPLTKADTSKVKPKGLNEPQFWVDTFRNFCLQSYPQIQVNDPQSKIKFMHPWFGPMTAREWYWLMPVHHGIHLKQIREIKKALQRELI